MTSRRSDTKGTGRNEEDSFKVRSLSTHPSWREASPPSDSLARALQVDFSKLGIRTLKRYKRRYRLKVRHNPTKLELVAAIHGHFASYKVEEAEVFDFFTYAAKNYKDKNLRDER